MNDGDAGAAFVLQALGDLADQGVIAEVHAHGLTQATRAFAMHDFAKGQAGVVSGVDVTVEDFQRFFDALAADIEFHAWRCGLRRRDISWLVLADVSAFGGAFLAACTPAHIAEFGADAQAAHLNLRFFFVQLDDGALGI